MKHNQDNFYLNFNKFCLQDNKQSNLSPLSTQRYYSVRINNQSSINVEPRNLTKKENLLQLLQIDEMLKKNKKQNQKISQKNYGNQSGNHDQFCQRFIGKRIYQNNNIQRIKSEYYFKKQLRSISNSFQLHNKCQNFANNSFINELSKFQKKTSVKVKQKRKNYFQYFGEPNFNKKFQQLDKKIKSNFDLLVDLKKINNQKYQRKIKKIKNENKQNFINIQKQNISYDLQKQMHPSYKYHQNLKYFNRLAKQVDQFNQFEENVFQKQISIKKSKSLLEYNHKQQKSQKFPKIQDFKLIKKLGSGSFGQVYLALHLRTNFLLCLKKISKQKIIQRNFTKQLCQEIRLHLMLKNNNIVNMYGYFSDFTHIYLILQYIHGKSLFSFVGSNNELTQQSIKQKITQICQGVKYIHSLQIIHRDLKPQNILISNDCCKICDFGWATIQNQNCRRKTTCGTLDYSAPQIVKGEQYDFSIDVWCIGILTYELFFGKSPFYHISKKKTLQNILNIQKQQIDFPKNISKKTKQFILFLLNPKGKQRPNINQVLKHYFLCQQIGLTKQKQTKI